MNEQPTSADVDRWIAELKAAGWVRKASNIWRAPNGRLYAGPLQAWRIMKSQQ